MKFIRSGSRRNPEVPLTIEGSKDGVVLLDNPTRISPTAVVEASNLMQTQVGRFGTTWGSAYYGPDLGAAIDGAFTYVKDDGSTELLALAGGTLYRVNVAAGTKTAIPGASFTAGVQADFLQIGSQVRIANGVDALCLYDGSNLIPYVPIANPTIPTATATVVGGAGFTYYYQVVAINTIGFTQASPERSIAVTKKRENWIVGTEYVTITWTAITGATGYQIYVTDRSGYGAWIADVQGQATTTFKDDGSQVPNTYTETPLDNTTGGPKFAKMELSGNRIWATGDPSNPWRVYVSGTAREVGFFSSFYGGGWFEIEKGGRERPTSLVHYRDGKGTNLITILTSNPESTGSTWQAEPTTQTVADTSFVVFSATKVTGSLGTSSRWGAVKVGDSVHFFNKRGVYVIGPKPSILNYLATDELSANIRPRIRELNSDGMTDVCGYYYDAKVFWSVPYTSSSNSRVMVFDTERRNWNPDAFTFGVRQFLEYTDSHGANHLLAVPTSGTQLIDISPNIQGFLGQPFTTSLVTGRQPVDPKNRRRYYRAKYAYVEINQPQGAISYELLVNDRSKGWVSAGSITIPDQVSTASTGWGADPWASVSWADSAETPRPSTTDSLVKRLRVNRTINEYQHRLKTTAINAKYAALLRFELTGRFVPSRDPSSYNI